MAVSAFLVFHGSRGERLVILFEVFGRFPRADDECQPAGSTGRPETPHLTGSPPHRAIVSFSLQASREQDPHEMDPGRMSAPLPPPLHFVGHQTPYLTPGIYPHDSNDVPCSGILQEGILRTIRQKGYNSDDIKMAMKFLASE